MARTNGLPTSVGLRSQVIAKLEINLWSTNISLLRFLGHVLVCIEAQDPTNITQCKPHERFRKLH